MHPVLGQLGRRGVPLRTRVGGASHMWRLGNTSLGAWPRNPVSSWGDWQGRGGQKSWSRGRQRQQSTRPRHQHVSWVAGLLAVCSTLEPSVQPDRQPVGAGHPKPLAQTSTPPATPKAAEAGGKPAWLRFLNMSSKRGAAATAAPFQAQPQTIEDMTAIVAANTPVFFFHNQEKYFPCTVEWFLERCRLVRVARGWKRRILQTLVDFGDLDGQRLAEEQATFSSTKPEKHARQFLQLELLPSAREGQPGDLNKIPIYAHVKQTLDPLLGKRDGIEINYMKFLAFNGPYKLFHSIWVGPLGAHDADWEHVTVRLTPDGQEVVGVYYSAHRHRDGAWRSASEVPLSDSGRPHAYIAENGHGSYPIAGTILRLFCVINDYTSSDGKRWDPEKVVLVTQNKDDKLPTVVSRGSSLDGSTYRPPLPPPGTQSAPYPQVEREDAPWLQYEGKWGSTVEAPQRQEWYLRAENPISRTWLQQILFPLLPGVETIWEPAKEEVEEALQNLREGLDEGMEAFQDATEEIQREFDQSRRQAYRRWKQIVRDIRRGKD